MTDREMLEFAAKAAGIKIDKSSCNGGGSRNIGFDVDGNAVLDWHNNKSWNPLTDDGDALRLAVKLRIGSVHALQQWSEENHEDAEAAWENDPYAATRRAIVRAAAEIGRQMP